MNESAEQFAEAVQAFFRGSAIKPLQGTDKIINGCCAVQAAYLARVPAGRGTFLWDMAREVRDLYGLSDLFVNWVMGGWDNGPPPNTDEWPALLSDESRRQSVEGYELGRRLWEEMNVPLRG